MLFTLWEYFIILFEAFLFFILTNNKLSLRKKTPVNTYLLQISFLFVGSLVLLKLNSLNLSTLFTVIWGIIFHLIYVQFFFTDSLFSKIFWTIVYTAYAIISDSLTVLIPLYFLHYPLAEVINGTGLIRIIFTLLYILIFTLLIIFSLSINNKTFRLSKVERLIFTIISTLCILIEQMVLISIINTYYHSSDQYFYTQVIIFILVFFLFFSLIFYVYNLGIAKENNEKLIEENLLTKLNNVQYEQVIASIEELRILKHDIHNHLATLALLINTGESDEASDYINKILKDLGQHHRLLSSGNLPIDCIISYKMIIAQSKKIPLDFTVHLPGNMPLNNIETCSLLGNLLDNAIESCTKIALEKDRFIHLCIKSFNDMLSIKVENSSNGNYKISKSGDFISTKKGHPEYINHGIGIKQIQNIVEKYNGFIRFTPGTDIFIAEILLPLNNDLKEDLYELRNCHFRR